MYKIHKWIAVMVGVFFLVWLISGIAMILPGSWFRSISQPKAAPVDFREVTVSPAEAIANLAKELNSYRGVSSISLRQIRGRVVYEIAVEPGESYLVDASSGGVFTITPEIAKQIARDEFPGQARALRVERVDRHGFTYPWGSLPVYGIVFDDDQATISFVSPKDGTVRRTTRMSRIQDVIARLHTFEPVKLITERGAVRKGLLVVLSMLGIGVAVTGYYLSIPRRRVSRSKLTPTTVMVQDHVVSDFKPSDEGLAPFLQRKK